MPLVEIKGVQFENRGARLMLQAVLDRLAGTRPDLGIAIAPHPLSPYPERARLGAWQKLSLRKRALDLNELSYRWPGAVSRFGRRFGVVTERDVDAVLDASGFAYGEAWGDWPIRYVTGELQRSGRHGKPYVFLPQAFGPFRGAATARLLGRALGHAALICPRDGESLAQLRALPGDFAGRLLPCPDFTIALRGEPRAADAWEVDERTLLLVPNSRMLEVARAGPGWRDGYLPLLAQLATRAQAGGFGVRILNHAGREDAEVCARLAALVGNAPIIDEPDPVRLKGVIGRSGLVVSSRYHGCVNALSQGVPCLATSWSHKYPALFSDYGVPGFVLVECDPATALERLDHLVADRTAWSERITGRQVELEAQVEFMWQRVFALLPSRAASAVREGMSR